MKKGLKYEKAAFRFVASQVCQKKLGKTNICFSQWLEFTDWNGRGFACPDFYFVLSDRIVLFEAKLTATSNADAQMSELYVPLLKKLYALPVVSCAIYRNGTADYCNPNLVKSFADLLDIPLEGDIPSSSWHFTPFR